MMRAFAWGFKALAFVGWGSALPHHNNHAALEYPPWWKWPQAPSPRRTPTAVQGRFANEL